MDTFPNLCLGVTPLLEFSNASAVAEVACRVPLDRLLLETDAPYLLPKSESGRLTQSHPGMVIHVATTLSKVCRFPFEDILDTVRQNSRKIYRI
ncbi:3'-5' RNA nuclease TATDN2-like [Dermacentor variabilis]|uniref:3'-5' RNA nuclease TATDN2-like n=1 Tax=Dermacentor variabilis TaxID=34621 RepID=UPI003F5C92F2